MKKFSEAVKDYQFPFDRLMTDVSTMFPDIERGSSGRYVKISLDPGGVLKITDIHGGSLEIYDSESFFIAIEKIKRLSDIKNERR